MRRLITFSEWTPKRCPPVFFCVAQVKPLFVCGKMGCCGVLKQDVWCWEWTPKRCPPVFGMLLSVSSKTKSVAHRTVLFVADGFWEWKSQGWPQVFSCNLLMGFVCGSLRGVLKCFFATRWLVYCLRLQCLSLLLPCPFIYLYALLVRPSCTCTLGWGQR